MLVVLFNLADLEDLGTNARNVEAVWITKGIFDFAKKLPNLKRQLLVFTQADRYAATLKAHGGAQGLYAAKMPMLKVLHPALPVIAIAAVAGTDADGRPKADYSSAACHELMRLILHEADSLAKTYVKACEQCAAALENFTGGAVAAFQSKCREYETAFNNLSNAARPLIYAYRSELDAHKNKLSLYADLGEQANALVLSHHVTNSPHSGFYETLTNPETWATLRARFLACQSQLTAFHNYYADLHEKTRLSVIVQQRAQQKLRQEQERAARIIRRIILVIVALVAIVVAAFGYERHKTHLLKLANALEGNLPAEGQAWTSPTAGMEFVWVPALKIWMGKYEVTNGEYRKKEPGHDSKDSNGDSLNGDRQPAVYVNFDDAKAYAAWLTQRDQAHLGGMRYRVISETEWQAAAQCGDGREYPWGNAMPPKYGNYHGQERAGTWAKIAGYNDVFPVTCPVERSGKNDWGLYGMGGNVWECCATDSSSGSFGAWRGASWDGDIPDFLRCTHRFRNNGSIRFIDGGFRLVLSR
jgi:hypothetical protein